MPCLLLLLGRLIFKDRAAQPTRGFEERKDKGEVSVATSHPHGTRQAVEWFESEMHPSGSHFEPLFPAGSDILGRLWNLTNETG